MSVGWAKRKRAHHSERRRIWWARRKRAFAHSTNCLSGHLQFPFFVLASPDQRETGGHGNGQAKGTIAASGTDRGEEEMDGSAGRWQNLGAQGHQVQGPQHALLENQSAAEAAHRDQPSPRRGF